MLTKRMSRICRIQMAKKNSVYKNLNIPPIVVGEVQTRLASKRLRSSVGTAARHMLEPLQVGVACPLGLEGSSHTLGQFSERHTSSADKSVLTIHFQSIFNTVNPTAFLQASRQNMPGVVSWPSWCYSTPSRLIHGDIATSNAGRRQSWPIIVSIGTPAGLAALEFHTGYRHCHRLAGRCRRGRGCRCRVPSTRGHAAVHSGTAFGLEHGEMRADPSRCAEIDLNDFPSDMRCIDNTCFKFLGMPIDNGDFVAESMLEKRTDAAAKLLDKIVCIEDRQAAYRLLMHCMGLIRTMHTTCPTGSWYN